MHFTLKRSAAAILLLGSSAVFAAQTGGFATTDGGNKTGSLARTASTMQGILSAIAEAKSAGKPLVVTYTGNEDALINQVIKDHTVDASGNCPKPRWNDAYREVQIKDNHLGITIQGANGSSANFGITMIKSSNIIIKNMKIGALAGAKNDADALRIDNSQNVWIDHNELFAVNNECKGSPDGDLTFESLLDIKKNAQNITVSYNVIRDGKKVGLMGHTQSGGTTDFQRTVTFHHNIYRNVNGRLPLQRGGVMHAYNNHYDKITGSGINVRANGRAIVERNYFENSKNPLTCRFDTNGCGKWHLIANNVTSAADNAKFGITWDSAGSGGINADTWTSTLAAKPSLPYTYEPVSPQCVKDKLHLYAGVGKNGAQLTAAACSGGAGSSSSASSSSSSRPSSSSSSSSSSNGGSTGTGVTFYQHTGYAGYAVTLGAGNYTLSQLAAKGIRNDDISSLRVPSGWKVVMYDHDNYGGASLTKTSDDPTLVDDRLGSGNWNDRISSVKITRGSASSSSSQASSSSSSASSSGGPVLSGTSDYPTGFSKCADAGGTCRVTSGDGWVAFGRKGKWVTKHVGAGKSIACTVAAFGRDPGGNPNKCSYKK